MDSMHESLLQFSLYRYLSEQNIGLLAPEMLIILAILAGVLYLSFSKAEPQRQGVVSWWLAMGASLVAMGWVLSQLLMTFEAGGTVFPVWMLSGVATEPFISMMVVDPLSVLIRLMLTLGTLLILFFTRDYLNRQASVPGEFYTILLGALVGGMFLAGATDLIMVFVSLETLSISSYILVAYLRGNVMSAEAGLKYLLYGGMATAILLFGFSLLYGLTGTTNFALIARQLAEVMQAFPMVGAIMMVMVLGGICFKLSAAPFHMWTPDVYEGAPTPVTAFLSVVSKIAAFGLAIRFFYPLVDAMAGWFAVLATVAVVSMVVGNVVALTQRNIKRLLAYSTIAHVGYLLLGLAIVTPATMSGVLYYLMAYLFMNLGAFAVAVYFNDLTGRDDIAAYAGLVRVRPGLALIFTVMLLSLAGIPITAGFFAKFFLFQAVAQAGNEYLWLVIVALLASTVSLYYYLNVVRLMVIAEPSDAVAALAANEHRAEAPQFAMALALSICLVGTLLLGLQAQPFMAIGAQAVKTMHDNSPTVSGRMMEPASPLLRAAR